MIGLDTNVLVRYLTLDDPEQSARATDLIEGAARDGVPLFVSAVVLCEIVWVLERAYGYRRPEIAIALEGLLRAAQLRFSDAALLWSAVADYRDGGADFADHVIGRQGVAAGCEATVTFDRALTHDPAFRLLEG